MRPSRLATLAICALPGMSVAETPFDGLWRSNPTAECVFAEGDGGTLKIEEGTLFGAASRCAMTDPVNVRDMEAVLYDMACEGEDESWTDRAMFLTAADGGLYLIWNGYTFKYERCDDDATVGTVATADEIGVTGGAGAGQDTD